MNLFKKYFQDVNKEIKEYYKIISSDFPEFLTPYIETDTMQRIGKIGHFCGMYNASTAIYNFKYYKTRLDHSIGVALITWHFTKDEKQTLAALFHDAGTPVFAHAIDYLNGDLIHQESTEIDLEKIIKEDNNLLTLLQNDGLSIEDISNYKRYPLVDNKRPKLCADRLDGIFLSNLIWAQGTSIGEIKKIYDDLSLVVNEDGAWEFSFKSSLCAKRLIELEQEINELTHSDNDYYFMSLLASIIQRLIDNKKITYIDLFKVTDDFVWQLIENEAAVDEILKQKYHEFKHLKQVPPQNLPPIKHRIIDPLVNGIRYSKI